MQRRHPLVQWLCMLLIGTFAAVVLTAPVAQAGMIATEAAISAQQRAELTALLERAEVREQLQLWGVDAAHAQERIAALSDDEIAELAARMDELPAGAGIVNALIFVFLVLLITDILGLTEVFPFVRGPDARH